MKMRAARASQKLKVSCTKILGLVKRVFLLYTLRTFNQLAKRDMRTCSLTISCLTHVQTPRLQELELAFFWGPGLHPRMGE